MHVLWAQSDFMGCRCWMSDGKSHGYGSILLDDGLAESLIVSQMGHTNIKTTKEHYYRNRRNADQIMSELDKVTAL